MADDSNGVNYLKAAFKWQYNLIGLAAALGFAAIGHDTLPLLMAGGLEMIYLSLVPQSARFQRLVRSWKYEEQKREREKGLSIMFRELPQELRARYANLDSICRGIRENYTRLSSTSQMFVDQMESKLEGLSQSYIRLLNSAFHHREYLRVTNCDGIRREAAQLQKELDQAPAKVQEINRKRIEILSKRVEKYGKIHENCEVIDAQCAAIEDVLQLIRDQSVTMHDPQQISDHLDSLVKDVEQTEETVREVESVFDIQALAIPDFDPGASPRNRVRN
jgi:hypothetical protein